MAEKQAQAPETPATVPPTNLARVTARLACPLCGQRGKGNAVEKAKRVTVTCGACAFVYATNRSNLEAIGAAVAAMGES